MMADCKHERIKPTLSAQTSLMHIAFHIFGFECEDCGKQWDMGNVADALRGDSKKGSSGVDWEVIIDALDGHPDIKQYAIQCWNREGE